MTWVATAIVGTAIVGSVVNKKASDSAATATKDASRAQVLEQQRQFDLSRGDMLPFLQAGQSQLPGLSRLAGMQAPQFQFDPTQIASDPGYQFQLQQGTQQLDRLAGQNRSLTSGNRLAGAQQFGQGLAATGVNDAFGRQLQTFATNEGAFGNQFGRMAQLAGLGSQTGQNLGVLGQAASSNIQSSIGAAGQAQAANALNRGQQTQNLLNTGLTTYGLYRGGFFR